ncbi:MAG: TlpA family protein disulfide reductase [Chloroflexi bacterium]|nr:TlpA family protein disulfide reductase [Chloroflexota bacterium]
MTFPQRWGVLGRWGIAMVCVSVAVVVACSDGSSGGDPGDGGDTGTNIEGDPKLDPAPDILLSAYTGKDRLGGSLLALSDLAGTPVVLNFWAALCPPCTAEMPDLQEFYDEFQDRLIVLGVDVGRYTGLGDRQDAVKLLDRLDITYPTAFDRGGTSVQLYEVLNMPTTFFITPKGEIFRKWPGVINKKSLVKISEEMLAAHSGSAS